jgi:hypothetical protein
MKMEKAIMATATKAKRKIKIIKITGMPRVRINRYYIIQRFLV